LIFLKKKQERNVSLIIKKNRKLSIIFRVFSLSFRSIYGSLIVRGGINHPKSRHFKYQIYLHISPLKCNKSRVTFHIIMQCKMSPEGNSNVYHNAYKSMNSLFQTGPTGVGPWISYLSNFNNVKIHVDVSN